MSQLTEDFMTLFSTIYGFDKEWNIESQIESKTMDDYNEFTQMITDNVGYPKMPEIPKFSEWPEFHLPSLNNAPIPQELIENPPYEGFPSAADFPDFPLGDFDDLWTTLLDVFEDFMDFMHEFDLGQLFMIPPPPPMGDKHHKRGHHEPEGTMHGFELSNLFGPPGPPPMGSTHHPPPMDNDWFFGLI